MVSHDSDYYAAYTSRVDNSVDPVQLASKKPADQEPRCFRNRIFPGAARLGLMWLAYVIPDNIDR